MLSKCRNMFMKNTKQETMEIIGLKSKSSVPVPAGPPTISSILKSDHSVNYPQREKQRPQEVTNSPLATLSVVGSHHSHPPPQEINKESLVVMQVSTREPEPVTLDLSIKKPRESNIAQIAKALPQHQLPSQQTHNIFRSSQPPSEQPPFYQQVVASSLAPKLSPKLSPSIITPGSVACSTGMPGAKAQCGSIIHGTPVSSPSIYNQSRYDQSAATLIRQVTPPHKETGSITQGTPVHQRTSIYPGPEYYSNKRTTLPAPSFYPPRPPAYNVEQRQIIMTDYVTSHQMPGATASAGSRSTREKLYYQPSPRQGVIQRHNTKPPSPGIGHYPPPPPGHEAFSSLVDVAVRQPSLPVPPPITISLPEHKGISSEEKRHLHEGLGERFNRESPHERFPSREQERYSRDNHKVHIQQPQTRESHHQPQHQIRDQQIRDQQMRDHQLHQIRENHQQIQHHRDLHQQQQIHQQIREQQMQREREQHAQQQKIRENHMQHMQQHRDIEQRPPRHQISNYPQRLIHDTHHSLDRHIQVSAYSREQQPPPQQPPVSRAHANAEQSVDGNSGRGRTGEGSTLTAASLIDAIITHQINQSSEGQNAGVSSGPCAAPQSQPTRPGDRLFQSFHRDTGPESNGKLSPMKPGVSPDTKGHGIQLSQPSIPLEHVEVFSISAPQGSRPSAYQGFDPQTWKLRRALQHKEVESLGRDKTEERNIVRYYPEPPVPLSPLDYVKNRIAEVMRTSEEEGATKSSDSPSASDMVIDESDTSVCQPSAPPSFITTSHTYTYPFSALSLSTGTTGVPISSQSVVKAGPEPVPEPAPLLSAQYEPLSDED
ncbi:hypothetical protein AAG570_012727 [Ranatra chinensis]|uniref:Uncharacterized protein n=1 Tax=Ranatra chinensis TaxID=642074 RepID=A0ABD0YEP4_9HEMI